MGADAVEHKPAAHVGKHAVVVGAGIGGLAAAAALADRFDHVTVIERDAPVEAPAARRGTPHIDFWHMLKPRSVLDDPHLVQSVAAEMQRMGGSRARSRITREDHQARSLAWRGGSP